MDALIDVLDQFGLRTGEKLSRKEVHARGELHRAVHLYLFNAQGELLLQRRSLKKDHYKGLWAISAAGHVDSGECSIDALRRETQEELGIQTKSMQFNFMFSYRHEGYLADNYIDRQFNDVYVTRSSMKLDEFRPNPEEVIDLKFVSLSDFLELVKNRDSSLADCYQSEVEELRNFLNTKVGIV